MLIPLKEYIEANKLCKPEDRILVAVSGGIDSVVLLDLLVKSSLKCSIAHCNFQLRGNESDQDDMFVHSLAEKYSIEIHSIRFNTQEYASKLGISTQMAARDLRYSWFNKIANDHGFSKIAIAHNSDDNIETFHLNLARGTGLSGITGIEPKSGRIIRPVLWATREVISGYCTDNSLIFREDSSNKKTDYKRNYLRWEILPKFKKLNPSYSETILKDLEFFRQSANMLDEYFYLLSDKILEKDGENVRIDITELQTIKEPTWFLFKCLSQYGYNSSQVKDIYNSISSESGKVFETEQYILIKDREYFILTRISESNKRVYSLDNTSGEIVVPVVLKWSVQSNKDYQIDRDSHIAHLDASKVNFPIKLRKWLPADSFQPFGMNNRKKLSDFFTDRKLTILEKEKVWLLLSDNEIVWIIGHRIDDRYKITEDTESILRIELTP